MSWPVKQPSFEPTKIEERRYSKEELERLLETKDKALSTMEKLSKDIREAYFTHLQILTEMIEKALKQKER